MFDWLSIEILQYACFPLCGVLCWFVAIPVIKNDIGYILETQIRVDEQFIDDLYTFARDWNKEQRVDARNLNKMRELRREIRSARSIVFGVMSAIFLLIILIPLGGFDLFALSTRTVISTFFCLGILLNTRRVIDSELVVGGHARSQVAEQTDPALLREMDDLSRRLDKLNKEDGEHASIGKGKRVAIWSLTFIVSLYRYVFVTGLIRFRKALYTRANDGSAKKCFEELLFLKFHEKPFIDEKKITVFEGRLEWALTPMQEVAAGIQYRVEQSGPMSKTAKEILNGLTDKELVWLQSASRFAKCSKLSERARTILAPGRTFGAIYSELEKAQRGIGQQYDRRTNRSAVLRPFEVVVTGIENEEELRIDGTIIEESESGFLFKTESEKWRAFPGRHPMRELPNLPRVTEHDLVISCVHEKGDFVHVGICQRTKLPSARIRSKYSL